MSTVPFSSSIFLPDAVLEESVSRLQQACHVWWLPDSGAPQESWWDWLSADELDRASRFYFSHHAQAWVANRARLRMLLGQYLQQDGKEILFAYDAAGKPGLANSRRALQFNLSHTDGMAVVVVADRRRVGIDVERLTATCDAMELARSAFSASEIASLGDVADQGERQAAFLRLWTCKEALLKGLGDGLSRSMTEFSVDIKSKVPFISECLWDRSAKEQWQLFSLDAPEGFIASLAVEDPERHPMRFISWSQEQWSR